MYANRIDRLQTAMTDTGVTAVLLSVGTDLPYFTGYEAMPLERITMLVVRPTGVPTLVIPELEVPRVKVDPAFEVRGWGEMEDSIGIVVDLAGDAGLVAVGDQCWSGFLLDLQRRIPGAFWQSATPLTLPMRMRKTADEVEALRATAASADRVAARLANQPFSGRTEADLTVWIEAALREEGNDGLSFQAIVASGPNAASPHHHGGSRVMTAGDTVVCDFGGRMGGYCSDTTRTFVVGEPSAAVAAAHAVLHSAQQAAVAAVRPGVTAESIDRVARQVIEEAGYGAYFIHRTGHGIGLDVHEHPYIVEGNDLILAPGMAFSIEPGIYMPGEYGMRIEDIVVVTEDGVDNLNRSSRELVSV
ncbi:MAG: Xaa-Pro peptidase family protein [Acidimicrobiia bacterium]|nr:Xaa-Pro peptidase family protein [Acidimicrobiia bacterium]